MLDALNEHATEDEIKRMIKMTDKDGKEDGAISLNEFKQMAYQQSLTPLGAAWSLSKQERDRLAKAKREAEDSDSESKQSDI